MNNTLRTLLQNKFWLAVFLFAIVICSYDCVMLFCEMVPMGVQSFLVKATRANLLQIQTYEDAEKIAKLITLSYTVFFSFLFFLGIISLRRKVSGLPQKYEEEDFDSLKVVDTGIFTKELFYCGERNKRIFFVQHGKRKTSKRETRAMFPVIFLILLFLSVFWVCSYYCLVWKIELHLFFPQHSQNPAIASSEKAKVVVSLLAVFQGFCLFLMMMFFKTTALGFPKKGKYKEGVIYALKKVKIGILRDQVFYCRKKGDIEEIDFVVGGDLEAAITAKHETKKFLIRDGQIIYI